MSISEQVKELRDYANLAPISKSEENMILRAADTIESLSAKLADKERIGEDCGGGWIYCNERFPQLTEYSHENVLKRLEIAYMTDTVRYVIGYFDGYKWMDKRNHEIENVITWKPFLKLPELYQGAKGIDND